jgi:hypothetical protein
VIGVAGFTAKLFVGLILAAHNTVFAAVEIRIAKINREVMAKSMHARHVPAQMAKQPKVLLVSRTDTKRVQHVRMTLFFSMVAVIRNCQAKLRLTLRPRGRRRLQPMSWQRPRRGQNLQLIIIV